MANSISTSTNANATGYCPGQLVALSASGDALVVWFDGTNVKWSYASSPYTSWTTATLISSLGGGPRWQAGIYQLSNDNVLLCTSNASANMVSYLFTYNSGSHSWSAGSAVTVLASSIAFAGGAVAMDKDAQGRIWAAWANNSSVVQVRYTTDNGTTWNASTTFSQVGGGVNNCINLAYCGDYIVVCICGTSAAWQYARIDAHAASLGSWSSLANITNCTMDNTVVATSFCGAPGSNYGIFVGDMGTIPAQYYNASANTWSSVTSIGAASTDQKPTVTTDGTDIYCLWCKRVGTNNYSLEYKKWLASSQTWDSASTQLEASGTNIQWPSAGYGNGGLGFVYIVGTASPWTVYFDRTTGTTTSTRTITSTAALQTTPTRTIPSTAALTTTNTRTIPSTAALLTTPTRSLPTSAALQTTNTRTVPSSAALQQTAARSIPTTAALFEMKTRTVPSTTALQTTKTRDISSTAALQTTPARTIPSSATLQTTNARTIPSTAALQQTATRTIPTSASLTSGLSRTIPTSAALQTTKTRTVIGTAALQTTNARTVPTSAALALPRRSIPTSAALFTTNARSIPTSASIEAGVVETNAELYVRSGLANMHVPDGTATEYIREGSATIFVRQP